MFVSYISFTSDIGCYARTENCGMGSSLGRVGQSDPIYQSTSNCNNSPVPNLSRPLNRSTDESFIQGKPRSKVKYSQIPSERCLNLSLKQ